jgi:hypothetical protein
MAAKSSRVARLKDLIVCLARIITNATAIGRHQQYQASLHPCERKPLDAMLRLSGHGESNPHGPMLRMKPHPQQRGTARAA